MRRRSTPTGGLRPRSHLANTRAVKVAGIAGKHQTEVLSSHHLMGAQHLQYFRDIGSEQHFCQALLSVARVRASLNDDPANEIIQVDPVDRAAKVTPPKVVRVEENH